MTIYDNLWQNLTLSDKIRKYLTIYQYLKTFDKNGHSSTKSKDNKYYWRISDNIGQYLSILDKFWQYCTIFVNIGHYLLISNNIITYLAILSRSCCFETFWIIIVLLVRVIEELSLLKIDFQPPISGCWQKTANNMHLKHKELKQG